jgi:energy-coupling factor transporter ATP-binding protein EcfA2
MKFSGKNFQAWQDFSLDIDGLTMVIGPSNEGKSSLCRALRGILRNEIDANYVRNPKDKPLELTLETGGHKIVATRPKKGSVRYDIDGEPFAKLDEEVPEKVKALKFGEIGIGDFSIDPIFAEQNFPQFLIDSTAYKPSLVNAVLGAFGGTEKLEHGKKEANLRKTQKDSEARLLAGQIRDAEERKAKLVDMTATGGLVGSALQSLEQEINILEAEDLWYTEAFQC